jgi:hypothetical protein
MPHSIDQIEQDLGHLINLSGKLRMLSHQLVMCALLHCANGPCEKDADAKFCDQGRAALREFKSITTLLTTPSDSDALSAATADLLRRHAPLKQVHVDQLNKFIAGADTLIAKPTANAATTLGTFVSGDLLKALNDVNADIRALLDQQIGDNRAAQRPLILATTQSVSEINRISKTLQIVAMNASIEAQRAGSAGVSFGVIAREMRTLSLQGMDQAKKLDADLSTFQSAHA